MVSVAATICPPHCTMCPAPCLPGGGIPLTASFGAHCTIIHNTHHICRMENEDISELSDALGLLPSPEIGPMRHAAGDPGSRGMMPMRHGPELVAPQLYSGVIEEASYQLQPPMNISSNNESCVQVGPWDKYHMRLRAGNFGDEPWALICVPSASSNGPV